ALFLHPTIVQRAPALQRLDPPRVGVEAHGLGAPVGAFALPRGADVDGDVRIFPVALEPFEERRRRLGRVGQGRASDLADDLALRNYLNLHARGEPTAQDERVVVDNAAVSTDWDGSTIVKVLPAPGSDWSSIAPPSATAMSRTSARPSPRPGVCFLAMGSRW